MIMLPLTWTLLTLSLWTLALGSSPILDLYPKILSTAIIHCDCDRSTCDTVYWYRSIHNGDKLQFIGKCNNANRYSHGPDVNKTKFKLTTKSSASFSLHIISVIEEDTGIYSCVLKDKKNEETWKPGIRLLPGVNPPTLPPVTKSKPPVRSVCHCSKRNSSQDGCGYLILWPLVGLLAALALAIICTLYYFSRLPKKCRHHFVKKR